MSRDEKEIVRQLRMGGAPEEEIAKLGFQDGGAGDFEIWPENADALRAFLFCSTQWRLTTGMGGAAYLGIDYGNVERCFRMEPPTFTTEKEAWWGVRMLEQEACRLRNEELAEEAERMEAESRG